MSGKLKVTGIDGRVWETECIIDPLNLIGPTSGKTLEGSLNTLRPPLAAFAAAMEAKLKKNDHKTGWRETPVEALRRLLEIELEEFKVAQEYFSADEARRELIDVANYAMILWDRLGVK